MDIRDAAVPFLPQQKIEKKKHTELPTCDTSGRGILFVSVRAVLFAMLCLGAGPPVIDHQSAKGLLLGLAVRAGLGPTTSACPACKMGAAKLPVRL